MEAECLPIAAELEVPGGTYRRLSVTSEQLHGLACVHCNDVKGPFTGTGHVRTQTRPGEYLVWAVVACPDHMGARS